MHAHEGVLSVNFHCFLQALSEKWSGLSQAAFMGQLSTLQDLSHVTQKLEVHSVCARECVP